MTSMFRRLGILLVILLCIFEMRGNTAPGKDHHGEGAWRDSIELKEFVFQEKGPRMLHLIAFVRDYSTLTTYTDTATLFREKWVDFMLPAYGKTKYQGWKMARILSTKSYFRFSNGSGRDSVSDKFNHHFTWSDWIRPIGDIPIPLKLRVNAHATDTVFGKYSPTEIWIRKGDTINVNVNVLADTCSRKWVPSMASFFNREEEMEEEEYYGDRRRNIEFDDFRVNYEFRNPLPDTLLARDLEFISTKIESRGRGRNLFRFNPFEEPFFIDTHSEIYIIDKELISVKEAKKWEKYGELDFSNIAPPEGIVPDIDDATKDLVARVNQINIDDERAHLRPDHKLAGRNLGPFKNKDVILKVLKNMVGLEHKRKSYY